MKNTEKRFDMKQFKVGSHKAIVIYEKNLEETVPLIKEGLLKASNLLKTGNDIIINVSSTEDKFVKNKMGGVTGFTLNSYTIFLNVYLKSNWSKVIMGTVAHEFNHVVRFQNTSYYWKGLTLLNSLALEGSAQCFEEDITGSVRPWSEALNEKEAKHIWTKLSDRLNIESKDLHDRVFLKENDKEFPHWSGYTVAYLILRKRLDEMGKTDWNKIIKMKPKALIGNGLS